MRRLRSMNWQNLLKLEFKAQSTLYFLLKIIFTIYSNYLDSNLLNQLLVLNIKFQKMTEYGHNSVILKKSNEARFNHLWAMFAKS